MWRQPELFGGEDLRGDDAEDRAGAAAIGEHVRAEARQAGDLVGEVGVVPIGELADSAELVRRVTAVIADPSVLRVKGFSAIVGKPMRLLVQAVGPRVTQHYDRAWAPREARQGNLVVIGLKGLDRAAIERQLQD